MSKFNPNNYLVKVLQNGVILNAFEIPSKSYSSAQLHAHHIAYSLYADIDYEVVIKVIK
jgi:hypothetical protein